MLTDLGPQNQLFRLGPVQPQTADRAFPLAHLYEPSLDRVAWRAYVRDQKKLVGEGGVMSLEDPRGYVHGLFSWSVRKDLERRRVLHIRDVILLHLPGHALQDAVMKHVADLAHARNCQSIVMDIEDKRQSLKPCALEEHGFRRIAEQTFTVDLPTD